MPGSGNDLQGSRKRIDGALSSDIVYGDGKQERDFTYVDDIAQGTLAVLKPIGYTVPGYHAAQAAYIF